MSTTVDVVVVQWGQRLFYPSNRIVKPAPTPRLDTMTRRKAAVIRRRIEATGTGRAPQVMVKVTGGGRGMAAIAAHFRYISKNGRLDIEDDRGVVREGKEAVHDLTEQWRYGGSLIDDVGHRREALNIMLSMPHGTDARVVQKAAREFAQAELPGQPRSLPARGPCRCPMSRRSRPSPAPWSPRAACVSGPAVPATVPDPC